LAGDVKSAYASLKRRSQRFVDAYMLGMTGVDAIKKAGFKGRRPDLAASKLTALPQVRAAIEERRAVLCEAVGLRQEEIVAGIMLLANESNGERNVRLSALRELAEIAGVKKVAAVQHSLGPGLQVVIQPVIQQIGGQQVGPALGVVVNLPGPA
jgi:hypothetical protein